jgi:hypothetical protein
MVDEGRRPGEQRLHAGYPRRGTDRDLVEGPVEAPPDAPQDLDEGPRRSQLVGHAADERGVGVGVGVDVAGDDEAAPAVEDRRSRRDRQRRRDRRNPAAGDRDVGDDDLDRIEPGYDRGAAQENRHRDRPATARLGVP